MSEILVQRRIFLRARIRRKIRTLLPSSRGDPSILVKFWPKLKNSLLSSFALCLRDSQWVQTYCLFPFSLHQKLSFHTLFLLLVVWFLLLSQTSRSFTLKMEAVSSSETLVDFYHTTRRHILGDSILHSHQCENLKSNNTF
jgi:hypothetical protein